MLCAVLLMLTWSAVAFVGTANGWFHWPIAGSRDLVAFREAVDIERSKQFVGNFAMAIMKNGAV